MTGKISKAYPNYDQYIPFPEPHNTSKWLESVKSMYYLVHKGADKTAAFDKTTSGWSNMEKKDFTQWLKYYEENAHKKYSSEEDTALPNKLAQVSYWQDVNRAGYFVPIAQDPGQQIESAKDPSQNAHVLAEEKRELIERQRAKVLSRLDSAERLVRSTDGQVFAGSEMEALLHIIYELKKKIQTVNKVSVASKIYEDIIVREANILTRRGFNKASSFLVKFAQDGTEPALANPTQPAAPTAGAGLPGPAIPVATPGIPSGNNNPNLAAEPAEEPIAEGMRLFLKKLDPADNLEVNDTEDKNLVVEAQDATPPAAPTDEAPKADIEVQEEVSSGKDFDNLVDRAFTNLTISDVVNKLEELAKIFKVREVPRQLAMIDMMLDRLGLASLFPTLAEAMNKSLDSNQYIASRIDDILSRLRGTLHTKHIDLTTETVSDSPEAQQAKKKLENDDAKEKERKKMRKEQEQADFDQGTSPEAEVKPEIEVEEDLSAPAKLTSQMPAAPAPPAPPPIPATTPLAPVK